MSNAHTLTPRGFPIKPASVCAEVLARLLRGEKLTALDAVAEASTTRLAAAVHYLTEAYGWPVNSVQIATGCRDGRVSRVAQYELRPEVIREAMSNGAADWCAEVHQARAAQRAKAARARREAQRINAARRLSNAQAPAGQWGLF